MGRFDGKVVFITGAARGQGRSHAVRFAAEGASIIGVDLCGDIAGVRYPLPTRTDLDTTASMVEDVGGKGIFEIGDVRSQKQLDAAVAAGVDQFGRLDVVCANAGIFTGVANSWTMTEDEWNSVIDIDLSGVWRTCKAAVPSMIDAGNGGSIIITATSNGFRAEHGHASYNAAKIGLLGLMRTLAGELGTHGIRVNTIHPTNVKTPMMWNDYLVDLLNPGKVCTDVDEESWWDGLSGMNILPVGAIEATDVTELVMFLASDGGRYITASSIPIDAGYIRRN